MNDLPNPPTLVARQLMTLRLSSYILAAMLLVPAFCGAQQDAHTTSTLTVETAPAKRELSRLAQAFEGERAYEDVKKQVGFGPRIPGTVGHQRQIDWMAKELEDAGFKVEIWEGGMFTPTLTRQPVPVFNLIARWKPERSRRLFFSAHFDTRPYSDGPNATAAERRMPVPGANDGGSGVAVVLEMARAIKAHPPENVGIFLVLHDTEDLGQPHSGQTRHPYSEFAVGAERLADAWKSHERFEAGVNLDLVGEREKPLFLKEQYSNTRNPQLVEEYWSIGLEYFPDVFSPEVQGIVTDDHVPYLVNDLPVINIIDLDFKEWHTPRDLPEAVSPDTLQKVGKTTLEFIHRRDRVSSEKP